MSGLAFGLGNAAMLLGLLGVAIPVVIHWLNRRRDPVIEWGAMQFLELDPWSRRRLNLADLALLLARMAVLAAVAFAMARPFLMPSSDAMSMSTPLGMSGGGSGPRDVVIVVDGSASMGRRLPGGRTPHGEAKAWATAFVARLGAADAVAVIDARDRSRAAVEPASMDRSRVIDAIKSLPEPSGAGDLPGAIGEAFRLLEGARNPGEIVVLGDGQRFAWKPGDASRWGLLRELWARPWASGVRPRLWVLDLGGGAPKGANGSVGPIELSRSVLAPGVPVEVSATVSNGGPGTLSRAVELYVDGSPGPAGPQAVGPIAPGGRARVSFRARLERPGGHVLSLRLSESDDPLAADDRSDRAVEVGEPWPVLLVDGEPGDPSKPLSGEVDFLRAALAPRGDEAPALKVGVSTSPTVEEVKAARVVVLANADRLKPEIVNALIDRVESGGGLLIAPGDRSRPEGLWASFEAARPGWLPATAGELKGDFAASKAAARPAPGTFSGPLFGPLGQGDRPPLGEAELFGYRVLVPASSGRAEVPARLDSGDPWLVERVAGRGRVALLAGPLDAEGGTLAVNPDFVPWVHELILHVGSGVDASVASAARPGEPLTFRLPSAPAAGVEMLDVVTPSGRRVPAPVVRNEAGGAVTLDGAEVREPGTYRVDVRRGSSAYATVASDPGESDLEPLAAAEASKLAEGWALEFEESPDGLAASVLRRGGSGRRDLWRFLVLAALGGLCVEIWLTRRAARA